MSSPQRRSALLLLVIATFLSGCKRGGGKSIETVYVSAPQAFLRDRVAPVFAKTGTVHNGDRLQVFDHQRRFVKVRTASGAEGWIEQRYLITQQVFDHFQQLAKESAGPVQSPATTRTDTNLHVEPTRDADHLFLLPSGTRLSLLKRASAAKQVSPGNSPPKGANAKDAGKASAEDWWLVRDPQGHAGWVLGRMLDPDVPLEIAQYAEGQRIVAFFVLNQVSDGDKKVPEYLTVLTQPKDGLPFDFDQIRVFTWNVRRHRYETAYREHNLNGVLPVTISHEDFGKEGSLPVFTLRVRDDQGQITEKKYKLNTPIVRRVYAPGEEPARPQTARRVRGRRHR
ncbi:MAG: SH3 domain-containing protein [Acidobacteriales bacterium]|nr:SH3 domain-containing protein [Terriglobales bacterium]